MRKKVRIKLLLAANEAFRACLQDIIDVDVTKERAEFAYVALYSAKVKARITLDFIRKYYGGAMKYEKGEKIRRKQAKKERKKARRERERNERESARAVTVGSAATYAGMLEEIENWK